MLRNLLSAIKEAIHDYVTHRLFVLMLVFLGLFGILILRLFSLQIVNGQDYLNDFTIRQKRTINVAASRGNILDRNGNILAYNKLAYSVTFGNSSELSEAAKKKGISESDLKNQVVYNTMQILEENGDSVIYDVFPIQIDATGKLQYTVEGTAKTRFLQDVYSVTSKEALKEHIDDDAETVYNYLKNGNNAITNSNRNFNISDSYSTEDSLKIMALRYKLWLNRYQQYVPVKIAVDVSDISIAQIAENQSDLYGMDIEVDSLRVYNDPIYFANIIGYIGNISSDEMTEYNSNLSEKNQYNSNDMIGKLGIEKELEDTLRGKKGSEEIFVDNLGRILEVTDSSEAMAGDNVYLTIDKDLQMYCYDALEQELASILLAHMTNSTSYGTEKNVLIPINDFYFALFNNNTLKMDSVRSDSASEGERAFLASFNAKQESAIASLGSQFLSTNTAMNALSDENKEYMEYIYTMLVKNNILDITIIPDNDETYTSYMNETISLGDYLKYAINQNAIDITNFNISSNYYDSDEVYQALEAYIEEELRLDSNFDKLLIKYMIQSGNVSGKQVCLLLYDQGILDSNVDEDYSSLASGSLSSYEFMRRKITKREITPGQLGLDPCSGSCVVTDVNTGEVLALVSYPSYDNSRLTNTIDPDYYTQLNSDLTSPMINRATMQRTAPGSTYKMLTSIAGVQEGVINVNTTIHDNSVFDEITPSPKCWIAPGSHGTIGISDALKVSCNYFYYEVGYLLGKDSSGTYNSNNGLERLNRYTTIFGLDRKSGIELPEAEPKVSNENAVTSAIGQGSNSYTPVQLARYVNTIAASGKCYDLSIVLQTMNNKDEVTSTTEHKCTENSDISDSLWSTVHTGMRLVITDNTAESSLFHKMNVAVAGKTGTAQEDKTRASHALFVSYAPYDNPEITVTTIIPFGHSSGNAQELASFIYAYYYQPELLENTSATGNNAHSD